MMSKYRIVQFGDGPYRIQIRGLFGWRMMEYGGPVLPPPGFHFFRFSTIEEAQEFIDRQTETAPVMRVVSEGKSKPGERASRYFNRLIANNGRR